MKTSAGLILYRKTADQLEVLLVHPGGPIWAKRDAGAWSIPKGEISPGEEPLDAAQREFAEELGSTIQGIFVPLGSITQKGGKVVHAWAVEGDLDVKGVKSNTFSMEWPPRSGGEQEFPEIDRAAFFSYDEAKRKINPAQVLLLDRLREHVR
ncbi:MAG TPA: NUDIX domain-containing protein [Bacteroidota bacterium]|nr:NUDIX domain-containing protein [Bacteroidota bacterium]